MSSIPETAQREADEAEREQHDDEPAEAVHIDGDAADEPNAEPVAVSLTPADIEKRMKKLETQAANHARRVAEILGDDFALLIPSPIDWTPGFVFSPDVMPLSDDQVAAVDAILGRATRGEYQPAKDAEACADCNALGDVLTGSKKPGQETKLCSSCQGSGWRTRLAAVPPMQPMPQPQYAGAPVASPTGGVQVADQWGRPFGHPHYGIDPSMVGV